MDSTKKRSSIPIIIWDWKKSYLMGLIRFHYYIEDRRPDLEVDSLAYIPRYKHHLHIYFPFHHMNWVFLSQYIYSYYPVDNNEVLGVEDNYLFIPDENGKLYTQEYKP
jgi:hypothetical protein